MISLTDREGELLQLLVDRKGATIAQLGERLGVSAVTVRNDLAALEEKGVAVRSRGGVFPAFHPAVLERRMAMVAEKERIARAAAALVEDGDRIMVVAGSTASLIPKYLLGKRDIQIVTNSTYLLPYARVSPALNVTFVGGEFSPAGEAMVGPIALRELDYFHVRRAFIGTDGFTLENGVTAHSVDLAEVVKKMVTRSQEAILVADSSKYGKVGFARIAPLDSMDRIITDTALSEESRARLGEQDIKLELV